uniref:Testis expressed 264, ER-phagy receptor n=1 Tax=Lepisosteus oculatus TaxID=7918 RepID=W5MXK2_LEPOC|nr:PREDICTED: testis-expressed sequence 264 protein isoform X1 [Lepisosteus oculatus]
MIMSDLVLLAPIAFLLLGLLLTILGYVLYSGLLTEIIVRTGSPPIRNITIAYKFKQGPYKECGSLFTESCSIGPKLSSIGVYYDDPKQVPAEKCRCAVGSILSEGEVKPSEELLRLYEKFGYKIFSFPEVTHVVTTAFPHRTFLSVMLGVHRVYPQLSSYIKERKLCAHPFLEIYRGDLIHYMSPLARQSDFYVPEVRDTERKLQADEESEDRQTDITEKVDVNLFQGEDSNSETGSVSQLAMSESRETSLATSVAPSLPPRDQDDGDNRSDRSDKGSNESVGSGSSFEELDLESIEGAENVGVTQAELRANKNQDVIAEERGAIVEGEE